MSTETNSKSLGRKTKVFHNGLVTATLASIGVGLTLMCAGIALGPPSFGNDWQTGICFIGLIFFLLFGGIFRLPGALLNRNKRVTIYENGFVRRDGKSRDVVLWKDIIAVRMNYERGDLLPSSTSIEIESRDRFIFIDPKDYWRGVRLGEYIQQKTLMQLNSRLSQLEKQKKAPLNELGNKAWEKGFCSSDGSDKSSTGNESSGTSSCSK